ncbi:MAG: arsenate reductase (azurin) large subunit [Hyphomicrobiaceae bacterium]|nr:arsenate reductase (azurin) large subunit [Hyphomicrobiaceae bacterium]
MPPRSAQTFTTVCQFCIVGCGYKVYKWPLGRDGGGAASANALGVDFRQQQPAFGKWIAPSMHSVITERDGTRFNIAIVPDDDCSVNGGLASVRGAGSAATLYAPDGPTKARLTTPLLDEGDGQRPTSWEEAAALGAAVIKAVADRWGADAVGMKFFDHGGGGGGFENNWAVGRLFFSGIGTRTASIHNRPAYNSEVHAAGDAGIAALTNAYVDAQLADTVLIVGANPYETQTNYFLNHMVKNLSGDSLSLKRGAFGGEAVEKGRMIVVDPRRTMTVAAAEAAAGKDRVLHLQIEPGSDIWLLNAIARIILQRNWHDGAFIGRHTETQTFEAYQRSSLMMDRPRADMLAEAAERTGVSIGEMEKAAQWIAAPKADGSSRRCLMHYEKGLIWGLKNYENIAAIVDLALLTGSLGKPGTGVSRLGGHQEGYVRPPYPGGRPALNVDEAVRRGAVKVYWVGGCNPLLTTLRAGTMETAFKDRGALVTASLRASKGRPIGERVAGVVEAMKQGGMFLLVQDIYPTASSRYAHLVLPAAGWGEMNLTSINGERRLRLYQRFMDPPGDAKPDWAIMALFATKLRELYAAEGNSLLASRFLDFDWASDEDVFMQARYAFKGTAADPVEGYAGVTYDLLRRLGSNGIQTPTRIVNNVVVGTARHYEDGRFGTPSGKARFITASPPYPGYAAKVEAQRKRYRFWINNGRSNHIWQTTYHHRFLDFFNERMPIPHLEMHPEDAAELLIAAGDVVEIVNDVGRVEAMAYPTDAVKRGHTFLIFGQPRGAAGELVSDHVDPATTIPYYKGAWADVRRIGPRPELSKTVSFLPQNVAE